jgi:hypothetical protein
MKTQVYYLFPKENDPIINKNNRRGLVFLYKLGQLGAKIEETGV